MRLSSYLKKQVEHIIFCHLSAYNCPATDVAYVIVSKDENKVVASALLNECGSVEIKENQYPMDAILFVYVSSKNGFWRQLFSGNVQKLIELEEDLYVRSTEAQSGDGYAYISKEYDTYAISCSTLPKHQNILNSTRWSWRPNFSIKIQKASKFPLRF